jgi:ribosomal protein L40E
MRSANAAEERICRAFRQADIITADQFRVAMDLLTATEDCDRCGATGDDGSSPNIPTCQKCDSTGQMRVIR